MTSYSQYDHIIIDTPPVLAVTDGIIISQYTGVARYAKSQMKELELTLNRFEQAGVKSQRLYQRYSTCERGLWLWL